VTVPFPEADDEFRAQQITIAPDGTAYVVPSGMHERLEGWLLPTVRSGTPKVTLALSGWICLRQAG